MSSHRFSLSRTKALLWATTVAAAILAFPALAASQPAAPPAKSPAKAPDWRGPESDFREVDGHIVGPWWQGAGPGVVYFTGRFAQKHKTFEKVGQTVARMTGRPYMEIHKEHVQGSDADRNGILAYPDGTARVRLFMMPGGNSFYNMCEVAGISELTPQKAKAERAKFVEARKIPMAAFRSGMNYVGCCGGFFAGASGFSVPRTLSTGWCLWPGKVANIGPGRRPPFPDVVFDAAKSDHPLYKATQGGVLKGMYYNGGPIGVPGDVADTEYFGKYEGGNMPPLAGDWFLISYRPSANLLSGRCVMTTGHPEAYHADFVEAMARYALAHDYEVPRRIVEPGTPVEGISGDGQMQYYCLTLETGRRVTASLTGMDGNCDLYLRAGLPPTFRDKDASSVATDARDERVALTARKTTTVFLGVYGRHTVLNGVKYTLNVEVK